jgi:adenosylcobyric acid synthase
MADLITSHVDVDAVLALLEHGPAELPTIVTRLTP